MSLLQPVGHRLGNSGLGKFVSTEQMGLWKKPKFDDTFGLSDFKRKVKKCPLKTRKTLETYSGTQCAFTIYLTIANGKFRASVKAVTQVDGHITKTLEQGLTLYRVLYWVPPKIQQQGLREQK